MRKNLRRTDAQLSYRHSLRLRFLAIVITAVTLLFGGLAYFLIGQFSQLALMMVKHEGLLLADAVESGIQQDVAAGDIAGIQNFTNRLVESRNINDIEINIVRLLDADSSAIVASNNSKNIESADEEEHAALMGALERNAPHIFIDRNTFDVDADDDLSSYTDPSHPDYYLPTGYRVVSITTPLVVDGRDWGSIGIEFSLRYLDQKLKQIYWYVGSALVAGLIVLTVGLIILLNRGFFDPLWKLAEAIHGFGVGRPVEPAMISGRRDELSVLTDEFSSMVQRLSEAEASNQQYRDRLKELVEERTREVTRTQEATILCMASLAETRDNETGGHIRRTQNYIKALAEHLRTHPKFSSVLTETSIDLIYKSAPLHDIGKVGIHDRILLKPGTLTPDEFEIMKLHTVYGRNALLAAQKTLGANSFLRFAQEIAYSHHEKWDGSGYPEGLKGEAIPVAGRLMAIADVYDALISKRVYKRAYRHEEAMALVRKGRGSHFDPDMLDAFVALEERIKAIAREHSDSASENEPAEILT